MTQTFLTLDTSDYEAASRLVMYLLKLYPGLTVDSMWVRNTLQSVYLIRCDHHFYAQVLDQMCREGKADLISGSGMFTVRIK